MFQGDVIYARDLSAPYNEELAAAYPADKLLKLAAIRVARAAGLRGRGLEPVS
jgi:hypothetical protein